MAGDQEQTGGGVDTAMVRELEGETGVEGGEALNVSLEAEVPEVLFEGMRQFISSNPDWDQYSLITSALAGFLFQNGCSDRSVTQFYLDGLFLRQ